MPTSKFLREAVLRTISYAEVFEFLPTQREIHRYLHSRHEIGFQRLSAIPEFRRLPALPPKSKVFREKWLAVNSAVKWFSRIPWIRGVWVTGALAAGAVKDDDDIDFLFLTDPQRLWLARACVVSIGMILGKYRSQWGVGSQKNLWCCNIWLEPDALALPPSRRTLYEARELAQAVPVYRRPGEKATALLEKNTWAQQFVANGFARAWRKSELLRSDGLRPWKFFSLPTAVLNTLLQAIQRRVMARKMSREEVGSSRAFFHPRDTRSWVRQRYETICDVKKIRPWFNEPAP